MSIKYKGEKWLTLDEAATYLGISTSQVVAEVRGDKLDATSIGGRLYVPLRAAAWYKSRSKASKLFERVAEWLTVLWPWS